MRYLISDKQLNLIVKEEEDKEENIGQLNVGYYDFNYFVKKCPFDYGTKEEKTKYTEEGYPIVQKRSYKDFFKDFAVVITNSTYEDINPESGVGFLLYISPDNKMYKLGMDSRRESVLSEINPKSIKRYEKKPITDEGLRKKLLKDLYLLWKDNKFKDANITYIKKDFTGNTIGVNKTVKF